MDISSIILVVLGLFLFETISSIDNAVVNADVLSTMEKRYRKWFLIWGILIAVFLVRGLLPWFIVWLANPSLGPIGAFQGTFSNDPEIMASVEKSSPLLLIAGGIFMLFLFLHWLFLEPKHFGLAGERFFSRQGAWFFAIVSILLLVIIWYALKKETMMAFAAAIGSSVFFIVHGFREYAHQFERQMLGAKNHLSNVSKLMYLEVLDASFSIDGVVGAFAFTLSVPLIILGNGLGAIVVRQLTIKGVDKIKKYFYLKNGAMYSIFFLGLVMLLKSFGVEIPEYVSPFIASFVIAFFFLKSTRELKNHL
ncbi:MAG: hypothetical protein COT33_00445 [Candidatus Nealsonbacteria bacterium CG08_land_8_20_14_0_20_38_20]|uniref:DUF475 domain-containing protein n=1 Tax=Candidatus Nealsonbacteria bacterium CG08_land_8_20_14_0_20_38_20 TaxID=1974705 RepID=A0A2H0YMK8_9BACT|nr:MAG: hypothetical protein COT33_00445 [Candidatus Nealsonbacteria bacterium CG08_land_8_20_14_0_20_38_20]